MSATAGSPAQGSQAVERMITIAVGLAALALFSRDWTRGFTHGIAEVGAMRVLAGEVPHRDFWTMYAPGHFYLLAGLFRIFGRQWLVSPIAASLLMAAATAGWFRIPRTLGLGRGAGLVVALLFALAVAGSPFHRNLGSYPPAWLLLTFAWWSAMREPTPSASALTGLLLGAAALFKHDVAAYSAIGVALLQLARGHASGLRGKQWLAPTTLTAGTALLTFGAPMAALARVAGAALWQDMVVFPATDFPIARPEVTPPWLPLAAFEGQRALRLVALDVGRSVGFALPVLGALAAAARAWVGGSERPPILGLLATFSLHRAACEVQINTHLLSLTALGALLFALAIRGLPWRPPWRAAPAALAALAWIGALALPPTVRLWMDPDPREAPVLRPGAAGVWTWRVDVERYERMARALEAHSAPGDRIYVGTHRHDAVIAGPTLPYFLLGRLPAVRHHEIHPAVTDRDRVQREMVEALERHRVPVVILRHAFPDAKLDRWKAQLKRKIPGVGSTRLDRYLRDHYREVERLEPFRVLARHSPAHPAAGPAPGAHRSPRAPFQPGWKAGGAMGSDPHRAVGLNPSSPLADEQPDGAPPQSAISASGPLRHPPGG